ncbi:MAG TPA: hypothetical protein VIK72_16965 [Clostridiaceae bacterium]
MIKITGKLEGELDIKRFYLEGVEIECICPKCKVTFEYDQYLSYPSVNEVMEIDLYCPDCDHEWMEEIKLSIGITSK